MVYIWRAIAVALWLSTVAALELVILHTNDLHTRFREANKYGGTCSEEDELEQNCYGGIARIVSKVKELRSLHENVLVLDAGDQFQGTLWFYHYKGKAVARFTQIIGYDAMAIGNHEFDNGIDGLIPFLSNVTFPVLSSNINATGEPSIEGLFLKFTLVDLPSNDTVGIIGYTTTETPSLSSPGRLLFNSEIESIREVVELLKSQGIDKIIALGHSGIDVDQQIAEEVDGLDIVIGGHTHTFLYTGEPPSNEDPYGEYPLVRHPVTDPEKNVLVVQDYAYGKYLGFLKVTFDEYGDVISWEGNPILLDKSVDKDNETFEEIERWSEPITALFHQEVGQTFVFLDGRYGICRLKECNLGNLIADAMVHKNIKHPDETHWNDVSIALMNSGGIRNSVEKARSISIGDILSIQPFRNTLDLMEITGATLLKALEKSVSEYKPGNPHGRFFQVSGLLVTYDLDQPVGQRVVSVEAKCTNCSIPEYHPVDPEEVYKVVLPTYIANGGDGYDMLVNERISYQIPGDLDTDVLTEYIEARSPITIGLERRIKFVDPPNPDSRPCDVSTATIAKTLHWLIFAPTLLALFAL